jgi:hypothetical protein
MMAAAEAGRLARAARVGGADEERGRVGVGVAVWRRAVGGVEG